MVFSTTSKFISYASVTSSRGISDAFIGSKACSICTCESDRCRSSNYPPSESSNSFDSGCAAVNQSEVGATAATYTIWQQLFLILAGFYMY